MSVIDLRNFVDIDIKRHVDSTVRGTRGTTALFTNVGTAGRTTKISNMKQAEETYAAIQNSQNLLQFCEVYFEHGGVELLICEGYQTITKDDVANLPDECVLVAHTSFDGELFEIAKEYEEDTTIYGIKEKIFVDRVDDLDVSDYVAKNYALKYSNEVGAEMTMAAYLSKIDCHGIDTVYDYSFTQELIPASNIDDDTFKELMENNVNVDIMLAGSVRNCGGNCTDGSDLTNSFVRIVLHQTATDRLLTLLTQKIKSNTGLGKIYSVLSQELDLYLRAGYLTTDKVWLDEDVKVVANNQSYTIIEKGTALTTGYLIKVLPLTSLSSSDKAERKAPLIYVILADQYGIRKITIRGEII